MAQAGSITPVVYPAAPGLDVRESLSHFIQRSLFLQKNTGDKSNKEEKY
jgi:hypothetical protein